MRFFEKKAFGGCKSKIYLFLEIRMLDVETVLRRRSVWHGDDFDWLGGHSANKEAPEVGSRGSWFLCNPSLTLQLMHLGTI